MSDSREDTRQVREAIERVVAYFHEHPDAAPAADTPATAVWQGGLACIARGAAGQGASLASDMPKSVGGGGTAPSPGWLLRAALANCDATLIAMRAAHEGIALTRLEVAVESDSDDRVMLGMAVDAPAGPLRMRVHVRLAAEGVVPERLHALVGWAERHSPVADAVRRAVPVALSVEIG